MINADRIVIVEFDTAAQARAFYHSAAYQAARQKRLPAAEFRMTLVEGPPAKEPLNNASNMAHCCY